MCPRLKAADLSDNIAGPLLRSFLVRIATFERSGDCRGFFRWRCFFRDLYSSHISNWKLGDGTSRQIVVALCAAIAVFRSWIPRVTDITILYTLNACDTQWRSYRTEHAYGIRTFWVVDDGLGTITRSTWSLDDAISNDIMLQSWICICVQIVKNRSPEEVQTRDSPDCSEKHRKSETPVMIGMFSGHSSP
jgi:hypothetical protein